MDKEYLRQLFISCLEADYKNTEAGGSYASVRDGDLLYLFFEQSNGAEDWINNLSYHAVSRGRAGDNWYCHEGFLRVFNSILPYLEPIIKSPSVERIITVGYSHGAAISVLFHEQIWYSRPDLRNDLQGFGFGCPRVIYGKVPLENERWRGFLTVKNIDDIVTHLPPAITGYRRVGNLLEIGTPGKYSGIDAHKAENYVKELS